MQNNYNNPTASVSANTGANVNKGTLIALSYMLDEDYKVIGHIDNLVHLVDNKNQLVMLDLNNKHRLTPNLGEKYLGETGRLKVQLKKICTPKSVEEIVEFIQHLESSSSLGVCNYADAVTLIAGKLNQNTKSNLSKKESNVFKNFSQVKEMKPVFDTVVEKSENRSSRETFQPDYVKTRF